MTRRLWVGQAINTGYQIATPFGAGTFRILRIYDSCLDRVLNLRKIHLSGTRKR